MEYPQYRNVPLLLLKTRELFMDELRPAMTRQDFTDQQWRIVRVLREEGELEPRELCEKCCILSPSMAGILKRMEEENMIIKSPSETDKRRVLVRLTPHVEEKIDQVIQENRQVYANLYKKIGEKDMQTLISILDRVQSKMKA